VAITEISIGPDKKKYSKKVTASSEEYLKEFDLTADNLSGDQRKIVFDFIKQRRTGWIISSFMSLMAIVWVLLSIFYVNMLSDMSRDFLPDLDISTCQNETHAHKEIDRLLIHTVFLLGILGGSILYSMGGCVFQIVFHFVTIRRKRKALEAFLPSVRSAVVKL